MPKNKGKGGKKNKKGKNNKGYGEIKRALELPNDGERIARVIKVLGNCRFRVFIYEESEESEESEALESKQKDDKSKNQSGECIAKLRGSLRKRGWIKPESYVIVSKREYATKQNIVDIVHLYKDAEAMELTSQGYIPSIHSDNEFGVINFSHNMNTADNSYYDLNDNMNTADNSYYDLNDNSDNEDDL